MKILYVIHKFPEISQAFIRNQICDMSSRGHDVSIICVFDQTSKFGNDPTFQHDLFSQNTFGDTYPQSAREWVHLAFIYLGRMLRTPRFWKPLWFVRKNDFIRQAVLISQILHYKKKIGSEPDIIHVHFADNAIAVAALQKAKFFQNTPIVVTFHGYDLHTFTPTYYQTLFQRADIFTVNSQYSSRKAIALGCPANKIKTIPVSFNSDFFVPHSRENSEKIRIIYVGRLCEFKGAHIAIEAFHELTRKFDAGVHFDVVGDGELSGYLANRIEELNLSGSVCLHGALHQSRVKELMNLADIFLFPGITDKNGRQENQGLVIQEAQAMELPVLASDVGGVPEGLVDGETGFVVPENDITAIVEKLLLLCRNDMLRKQMGASGRQFVLEHYTMAIIGDRTETLYKGLLAPRAEPIDA